MGLIRVVIADDHAMLREGITHLLSRERDIKVVAHATADGELEGTVQKFKPDVLLVAPSCVKNLEHIRALHKKTPRLGILIVTPDPRKEELLGYLRAGAKGTISKRETGASLAKAIRAIIAGEVWIARKVTADIVEELAALTEQAERPERTLEEYLTPRELRVAERVARGFSNRGIAGDLGLSEQTVKNHLSNIYRKMGLQNRAQLGALHFQRGRKH